MRDPETLPGGRLYGKLHMANGAPWGTIWRSRHDEPPEDAPGLLLSQMLHEPDDAAIEAGREMLAAARELLTRREFAVLQMRIWHGMTLDESGMAFMVTRERIRQIEGKALRKLRQYAHEKRIRP